MPSRPSGTSTAYHECAGRCTVSEDAINEQEEDRLLDRITTNPEIYGGKPIIRGRRLAVEHVLGMLSAGDTPEILLAGYPWLEPEDVEACLVFARRMAGPEVIEPLPTAMNSDT